MTTVKMIFRCKHCARWGLDKKYFEGITDEQELMLAQFSPTQISKIYTECKEPSCISCSYGLSSDKKLAKTILLRGASSELMFPLVMIGEPEDLLHLCRRSQESFLSQNNMIYTDLRIPEEEPSSKRIKKG